MSEPSIHTSADELVETEASVLRLGVKQLTFAASDGGTLPYCQCTAGDDLPGDYALLVFLHGAGSVGTDNWKPVRIPGPPLKRYLARHGEKAVVLFPQCAEGCKWVDVPWESSSHSLPDEPSTHMRRLMESFESKLKELPINRSRIYAGGISMGGYGAWDLVSRYPTTFAGILAICGGADTGQAPNLARLPAYIIHGDDDPAVPVCRARDIASALKQVGNTQVVYRELPNAGHNAWTPSFADETALQWLFSQRRNRD